MEARAQIMFKIIFCWTREDGSRNTSAHRNQEKLMPYPSGHSAEVRGKIIQSARRLFNRHGFDSVSLDQIMAGAGLTRGGFYSYFRSKSDLYAEVLGCFFTDPEWKSCWEGVEVDLASRDVGPQVVRAYLSRQHFEDVENSCPMVALPTDVTRSGESAKHAFETVFGAMVSVLERSLKQGRRSRCTRAQAIAALCVGGMVVARALGDRSHADELRDACMSVALELGGWDKPVGTSTAEQPTKRRDVSRLD
jgi:TetR/AcrR family transcriptional regulator, transcriptional repressor for nem operon